MKSKLLIPHAQWLKCKNENRSVFLCWTIQVIHKESGQNISPLVSTSNKTTLQPRGERRRIGFLRRKNPSEFLTRTTSSSSRGVRFLVPLYVHFTRFILSFRSDPRVFPSCSFLLRSTPLCLWGARKPSSIRVIRKGKGNCNNSTEKRDFTKDRTFWITLIIFEKKKKTRLKEVQVDREVFKFRPEWSIIFLHFQANVDLWN